MGRIPVSVSCAAMVLVSSVAFAQKTVDQVQKFPGHGTLHLPVPAAWKVTIQGQLGAPPTLEFRPRSGDDFRVLLTVVATRSGREEAFEPSELRDAVVRAGQAPLAQAVEKSLEVKELSESQNPCFYFSLTDRDPGESYKYLTQGHARIGTLTAALTVLHRSADSKARDMALAMIRGAKLAAP